jgi:hypothetical protein
MIDAIVGARGARGHGAEVFSLMRDSPLDAQSYLDTHVDTGAERQKEVR